jgi:hypothetical protein
MQPINEKYRVRKNKISEKQNRTMKKLYFIACLHCCIFLIAGCNSSDAKEENQNSSVEASEQKAETPNVENVVAKTTEKIADSAETVKTDQENEPFDYLEKLNLDSHGKIFVKYSSSSTQVYNQPLGELNESDPLYYGENGPGMDDLKVLKTKIAASGPEYYVVFSWGPSGDPSFMFYEDGSFERPVFSVMALQLYIPGNGNVYTAGHTNNKFNTRKKYTVRNGSFVEAEQPFYYVGLKTKMLKPAKLYNTEQLSKVVASLPIDYSVEVLINKPKTNLFLLRTDFGLTGWIEIPGENMFYGNEMIEGIFYAGD